MSITTVPTPVKLVMSLIFGLEADLNRILDALVTKFGPTDFISENMNFNYTDYYHEEMGKPLFRKFVSFSGLVQRTMLPDIKLFTNELEKLYAKKNGGRNVNVDPGYLSPENFILATGKNFTHRVYLNNGIYADLTLIFKNKSFEPLEWTYPDYRSANTIKILNTLRDKYLYQLKK